MKIVIAGAGSIGCYVGACCAHAGLDVSLIARSRIRDELLEHGLRATDWKGHDFRVPPSRLQVDENPALCDDADVVLITVKSRDTAGIAEQISSYIRPNTLIASLQNGVSNAEVLRKALPRNPVTAVMVPWNVVHQGPAHFHCGTEGQLAVGMPEGHALLSLFQRAGLDAKGYPDMQAVLWGKLLLNLNNAINALSDIPLREQLSRLEYRKILAACIREALAACQAAGIKPARTGKVLPGLLPFVLELPDWLFRRLAAAMLKMDENARSSMWEDITRGRPTEVDYLNGEIVRLARDHGLDAPANARIVDLVHRAESSAGSPGLTAAEIIIGQGGA